MTIYQEVILDHSAKPRNVGSIPDATGSVQVHNPLCGDKLKMDVLVENGKLVDIKFMPKGCAISKASASLLSEHIKGKTVIELKKITKKDIMKLLGIDLGPNRVKCALLPLEALHKLLISL